MKDFLIYFRLQLKRAVKMLPRMLAVTLLLAVLTALAALLLSRLQKNNDESKELIHIGLVGDLTQGYLAEGLEMFQSIDSSRFSLSFDNLSAEEADRALRRGDIGGYAVIPDGFAEALMEGVHLPITYVSASGGADIGAKITRELVETISSLVLETENAVYGLQDYTADYLPQFNPYDEGNNLVWRYGLRILDRDILYEIQTVEAEQTLGMPAYYLCGVSLLFLMLWAISCTPLFAGRSRELGRILRAEGLSSAGQVLAEYLSYVMLMLFGLLCAGLLAGALMGRFEISIPELEAFSGGKMLRLALSALPTALMICALQFLLFELADGTIGGVLLQFLNTAVQGYLAGCFYPTSFFPEALQRVGALLPAGAGMNHLRSLLMQKASFAATAPVWGWMLLFLLGSVLLRRRRNLS